MSGHGAQRLVPMRQRKRLKVFIIFMTLRERSSVKKTSWSFRHFCHQLFSSYNPQQDIVVVTELRKTLYTLKTNLVYVQMTENMNENDWFWIFRSCPAIIWNNNLIWFFNLKFMEIEWYWQNFFDYHIPLPLIFKFRLIWLSNESIIDIYPKSNECVKTLFNCFKRLYRIYRYKNYFW